MSEPRSELILVVDDEEAIRTYLRITLSSEGYRVLSAACGWEALELVRQHHPDAVLLDLGLPDLSGLEVTRHLRTWTWLPIIFLSVRDDEQTKVEALDAGGDDYLPKPFGRLELLARLRANLRRKGVIPAGDVLHLGPLSLDSNSRVVTQDGLSLPLTPTEFRILFVLMRNAGKLVTHRQILVEVWGPAAAEDTHMLRVNIFNLRKKLERQPGGARCLINEPGIGYRLIDPRELLESERPLPAHGLGPGAGNGLEGDLSGC